MLDVHPPHVAAHGWRDFFVHLFTITVGLLIALSLEGCVEWRHHRQLVREAKESLHEEIKANSVSVSEALTALHKQQDSLKRDVEVLNYIVTNKKAPSNSSMEIGYSIHSLRDVSWRTAQATTALSLMSYKEAQEYADIYSTQEKLNAVDQQAARDTILSLAPMAGGNDTDPTGGEAVEVRSRIQTLQGQLMLVDSLLKGLDQQYKEFLAAHPGES
jgi:hypothetical protein